MGELFPVVFVVFHAFLSSLPSVSQYLCLLRHKYAIITITIMYSRLETAYSHRIKRLGYFVIRTGIEHNFILSNAFCLRLISYFVSITTQERVPSQ